LLIGQAGPALAGGVGISAIVLYLLLVRLRRSTNAIEEGRRLAEHQALHDGLTDLPNRGLIDQHLTTLLATAPASERLWVLLLDLDRFKQVNDTLGHQAGDDLICAVRDRIRLVVGPDMFLARLGGDEYALVSLSGDAPGGVQDLAARL